jgi:hypothetical protein
MLAFQLLEGLLCLHVQRLVDCRTISACGVSSCPNSTKNLPALGHIPGGRHPAAAKHLPDSSLSDRLRLHCPEPCRLHQRRRCCQLSKLEKAHFSSSPRPQHPHRRLIKQAEPGSGGPMGTEQQEGTSCLWSARQVGSSIQEACRAAKGLSLLLTGPNPASEAQLGSGAGPHLCVVVPCMRHLAASGHANICSTISCAFFGPEPAMMPPAASICALTLPTDRLTDSGAPLLHRRCCTPPPSVPRTENRFK